MFYPLNPECETNPNVPMRDITLRNIHSTGSILPAGIVRCNATNPCTGFKFENVQMHSLLWDLLQLPFITEYAYGEAINVYPKTFFLNKGEPVHLKDNTIGQYRTVLAYGIKLFTSLFGTQSLTSIASDIVGDYLKVQMRDLVTEHETTRMIN